MNPYYVFSVGFGKISNLLAVLLFSYLLSTRYFGTYSSIATNALLINLFSGAWIVNFAWKEISQCEVSILPQVHFEIGRLILLTIGLVLVLCAVAVITLPWPSAGQWIFATTIWGMTTLVFDTALVAFNASGDSKSYANLTLFRGIVGLGLSAALITIGFGLWGAIAGQVIGNLCVLIFSKSTMTKWRHVERPVTARINVLSAIKFGLASVLALNIYMIANAVSRNTLLIAMGPEYAGYASLAGDLFYAPVALFAMSISLSKIPELYRAAGDASESAENAAVLFILSNIAVILPYIVGGAFVAAEIATMVVDAKMKSAVASIAPLAVVQSGCLGLLATFATIALTSGRTARAVWITLGAVITIVAAQLIARPYHSLYAYSIAMAGALAMASTFNLLASKALLGVRVPMREVMRILVACGAMALTLALVSKLHLPLSPIPEIFVGGGAYLLSAWALSCNSVLQLLRRPPRNFAAAG